MRDGGIVKKILLKTIPQPPAASAPFTQGSLSECRFLDLTIHKVMKKAYKNVYLRKVRKKKLFSESKKHRKPSLCKRKAASAP